MTQQRLLPEGLISQSFRDAQLAPRSGGEKPELKGNHAERVSASISELQEMMKAGSLTAAGLVADLIERIEALDWDGPKLRSVFEINPEAIAIANSLDQERDHSSIRGPLHGVPVLLKDNIDTADEMQTTAGSLALLGNRPKRDATVAAQLRAAGAILLGKTNMSEWANFRSNHSSSGWSGRGGLTRNAHDTLRSASGSSSGSAVAVAAGFAPIAIGTETDGSIVCPASVNGVVGFKPTVGLTSRAGVIPISGSQDSVGVFARIVTDVALTMNVLLGVDTRDAATSDSGHIAGTDFTLALDSNALRGKRLGVPTNYGFVGYSEKQAVLFEEVLQALDALGAEIVMGTDVPTADALGERPGEYQRLLWEYQRDLNAYLEERNHPTVRTLNDIIAFNDAHPEEELAWFGQDILEAASESYDPLDLQRLNDRLSRLSREEGIDAMLREHRLDALIAPTMAPATMIDTIHGEAHKGGASQLAAIAGYPIISVPAGTIDGMPVGLSFFGTAWSDAELLAMAHAWEHHTEMFRHPSLQPGGTCERGIWGPVVHT